MNKGLAVLVPLDVLGLVRGLDGYLIHHKYVLAMPVAVIQSESEMKLDSLTHIQATSIHLRFDDGLKHFMTIRADTSFKGLGVKLLSLHVGADPSGQLIRAQCGWIKIDLTLFGLLNHFQVLDHLHVENDHIVEVGPAVGRRTL